MFQTKMSVRFIKLEDAATTLVNCKECSNLSFNALLYTFLEPFLGKFLDLCSSCKRTWHAYPRCPSADSSCLYTIQW